ncbi:DNA repair protein RecO [uncultured Eubacteriales bacterium]|uniref:DNA repair protein RecO n=1 Tax=uncultured Eubacteriales bacterium TaxID=172733 RepID=A0A212J8R4_9FIRM|nr:DNA repair protein RecO [uncultured Eubacteriales bacterium]
MHIVTQGLVLREVNYKESDKILTVLTREGGKRTVKAQGCRRKGSRLAASAQLLVWSDMTLFEYKDYWSLNEAESQEQFWGLKKDVEKLALGSYFAEVAETVAEEGRSDPDLLSLILNSLYALDKLQKPQALVKAVFELKLMCLTGYEPMLDACAACGVENPEEPRFHISEGVLHCASCRSEVGDGVSMPLTPGALAAMRHVVYGDPKRLFSIPIDAEGLTRLADLCEAYLLTQLERGFRTLDFYKSLKLP